MTSFSSEFFASSAYVRPGSSYSSYFAAVWPPEAGCIGLSADPSAGAGDVSRVVATVTDGATSMLARSLVDGTSIKVTHFAVGTSGYDPSNPLHSISVDPAATSLISEVYRDTIDLVEIASLDGTSLSFVGRLGREELVAGIGEIALFATIIHSPYPHEIGTQFMFALAHQPLNVKTFNHVASYRIIVTLR